MKCLVLEYFLRTDSNSRDNVDHLTKKNSQFFYTNVPAEDVIVNSQIEHSMMEIRNCMKWHITIFETGKELICKEYLCDCGPCLNLDFKNCQRKENQNSGRGF